MKSFTLLSALLACGIAMGGVLPAVEPGSELAGALVQDSRLLRRTGCTANNCARAVTGTDPRIPVTRRQSDCSSFMLATVTLPTSTVTETVVDTVTSTVASTATDTTTTTTTTTTVATATSTATDTATSTFSVQPLLRRQQTVVPSNIPTYASACSSNVSKYSSACSCWGITATTVTVPGPTVTEYTTQTTTASTTVITTESATEVITEITTGTTTEATTTTTTAITTTTVAPPMSTYTGVFTITDATSGNSLGYVGKDYSSTGYMFITTSLANALLVSFTVPQGATSGTSLELTMLNSNNLRPFFGFVKGRDSTDASLRPGSFNYVYQSGVAHTAPGSTPQVAGSTYNDITGSSNPSESSIWSIDVTTGAVSATWINPDGNPAQNVQLFAQSNALYAGSDPQQFLNRYPAAVTTLTYTFVVQQQ